MSTPSQEEALVASYIRAAGAEEGGRYLLKAEELTWLLRDAYQRNTLRLHLLTALQRAVPLPKGQEGGEPSPQDSLIEGLKGVLTNAIIMQMRLNEREEHLVKLLEEATEKELVRRIAADSEDVRQWARSILGAYQHLRAVAASER